MSDKRRTAEPSTLQANAISNETGSLIDRLKRSPIFRVTTAYAIVSWVVLQLAEITFEIAIERPEGATLADW